MTRRNGRRFSLLVLLAAVWFLAGRGAVGAQTQGNTTKAAKATKSSKAPAAVPQPKKSIGNSSAPIMMEVFSDFQCPACRSLFFESLQPLVVDYVHPGKVYLVHRDTPLPTHSYARDAARYANAAATIGKFEKVAEAIYVAQDKWSTNPVLLETAVAAVLTPEELKRVRARLRDAVVEAAIEKDLQLGRLNRVTSTPTVILTHRGQTIPLPGGVNYPLLRRILDQLLGQS